MAKAVWIDARNLVMNPQAMVIHHPVVSHHYSRGCGMCQGNTIIESVVWVNCTRLDTGICHCI